MNEKVFITGGYGNLGKELVKVFPNALAPSHAELDIASREDVFKFIEKHKPKIIIHAAALTGVRECDEDKEKAWKTNIGGTANIVDACLQFVPDAYIIYVSTACVFDGERGMYAEKDIPNPDNFYALTKLIGEFEAKRFKNSLIVRTNFVAKEKWKYSKAFIDRFGTYLFAGGVAEGIRDVIEAKLTGIVHIVGDRKISMFELAKMTTDNVQPMTLKEYNGPKLTRDMSLDTTIWKKYKIC
jgi:dTDP-4-dehydrorhamnose reductase